MKTYSGNIVDILNREIYPATIHVDKGIITEIHPEDKTFEQYICPGFIDAHIHIESSMLPPDEFARVAVTHGTVASVSDPHEIANVLGIKGVEYMIENGNRVPFKFYFSAPSCVPATNMESSGAILDSKDVDDLLKKDEIKYLGEMMNFPGVIHEDSSILKKLESARKYNKKVDGHAPGLSGEMLSKYIQAGISTDHEANTLEEALEKLDLGMKIQIREGSAEKNFEVLKDLIHDHYEMCMFCSDDKHPDDLKKGHINDLVKRAINSGIDIFKVLQVACIVPVLHYGLDVGLLRIGDPADFIIMDNLSDLNVNKTIIEGIEVACNGNPNWHFIKPELINNFNISYKNVSDFEIKAKKTKVKVIEAYGNSLTTKSSEAILKVKDGLLIPDLENDILPIALVNRYKDSDPALAFIKNFGLEKGAIASSVGHDSHNIIVVGSNKEDMTAAVNLIIKYKGGIAAVCSAENVKEILKLPIAGLMSDEDYPSVSEKYEKLDSTAKSFGSKLSAPFMTLSFMSLLVIPSLKLSDKGLFDGDKFEFTDLYLPD